MCIRDRYGIATKIILPLTKPAFASMGILSAMGVWNAILWPLLVLKGAEKFTPVSYTHLR